MAKNLSKIRPDAEFSTGERDGEHTDLGQLVKYGQNLRGTEFVRKGSMGWVETMEASQVAAVGQFERDSFGLAQVSCS